MSAGTLTNITENGINLIFEVTIGTAKYLAVVSKIIFDALPTNLDKQNFIIGIIRDSRRVNRQFETIYPVLIGNILNIPD